MKSTSLKPRTYQKKVVPRRPKFADERYMGPEPEDNVTVMENDHCTMIQALNWYNYFYDAGESQKWLVSYLEANADSQPAYKAMIKPISNAPSWRISRTYGTIALLLTRGWSFPEDVMKRFNQHITSVYEAYKPKKSSEALGGRFVSVYERTKEKAAVESTVLLDDYIDSMLAGEKLTPFYDSLVSNKANPATAKMIKLKVLDILKDFDAPDINETLSKKAVRDRKQFYQGILTDVDRFTFNKKTTRVRKTRKTRVKTADKVVAKVKYCKEFTELKLVSISPEKVIKASSLWTYNTKYKQLAVYNAKDDNGLSIKGTTILNYNEETSIVKRLRKPDAITKEVLSLGKVPLRQLMGKLSTSASKARGRLNEDTVLLRVT